MYKVMYNDIVIDLLKSIRYGKYIPATKRVVAADKLSADCIVASNLKDRYLLKGVPTPDGCPYIKVTVVPITDKEYYDLLNSEESVYDSGIKQLRKNKIEQLRNICNHNIVQGLQIELSDKKLHHFTMYVEDQLNLLEIRSLIAAGETEFVYHESDGEYKLFSKEDMEKIILETFRHKQTQLLRFNKLKQYINQLQSLDAISKITYSSNLK